MELTDDEARALVACAFDPRFVRALEARADDPGAATLLDLVRLTHLRCHVQRARRDGSGPAPWDTCPHPEV